MAVVQRVTPLNSLSRGPSRPRAWHLVVLPTVALPALESEDGISKPLE
jgi:hypothetical protein